MRGRIRGAKVAVLFVVCAWVGVLAATGAVAVAGEPGTVTAKQARGKVKSAARQVERAQARLSKARAVEDATRQFTSLYGPNVGRWVWLASDVGWPRSEWGRLFYTMNRESGGNRTAKNPTSTASGLGQFLAFWFDGSDASIARFFRSHGLKYPWDVWNARDHLAHWWCVVKYMGWTPWDM